MGKAQGESQMAWGHDREGQDHLGNAKHQMRSCMLGPDMKLYTAPSRLETHLMSVYYTPLGFVDMISGLIQTSPPLYRGSY